MAIHNIPDRTAEVARWVKQAGAALHAIQSSQGLLDRGLIFNQRGTMNRASIASVHFIQEAQRDQIAASAELQRYGWTGGVAGFEAQLSQTTAAAAGWNSYILGRLQELTGADIFTEATGLSDGVSVTTIQQVTTFNQTMSDEIRGSQALTILVDEFDRLGL